MVVKKIFIYCRYSSDMQRADSCVTQERDVRAALARYGLPALDIVVIYDEAESGTKVGRDLFQHLLDLVGSGAVAVLLVDDQSRLTRAHNAFAFVTDVVYAGGRFISTKEGIDTAVDGWELKVKVLELHHGQTIRDLQHRVRRGQRGRVEADGSAGDFPFGYESYHLDPDGSAQLARRGPKPKKGVCVCEDEARWVRQAFEWFVAGRSIGWIARRLTHEKVAKGRRASKAGWHPQQVRRLLANEKYVGVWVWGRTTTIRNSRGEKRQIAVPPEDVVIRKRPDLRIVGQDLWEQATARLAALGETFGAKPGQKPRGPRPNPAVAYPRSPLGGVLVCGVCSAKLWQHHSNARRYYACPGAKKGLCPMTAQAPAERAERALVDRLLGLVRGWPDWMRAVYRLTCEAVRAAADRAPAERDRDERRAKELDRQIRNLVSALADGRLISAAVSAQLREAETEKAEIDLRLAAPAGADPAALPDEAWVAAHLDEWAGQAAAAGPAGLLRLALAAVVAEPVLALGKTRGFVRLTARVKAWDLLAAAMGGALPAAARALMPPAPGAEGPAFVVDLGGPTAMDRWAPAIVAWRAAGVPWKEIVRRTGLDLNRAYRAWARHTGAGGGPPAT